MAEDLVYFNGINGATGSYLVPPKPVAAIAGTARHEPPRSPEEASLVKRVRDRLRRPYLTLPFDVDPTKIAQAGWAVVFAQDTPQGVRTALQPLIEHRRRFVLPDRCKVLDYKGESMRQWLQDRGATPGTVTPSRIPYYLLLVGNPVAIPFEFQYLLDIEYAIGRLCFDSPGEYEQYARSIVDYEKASAAPNARDIAYWATRHSDRDATQMSADWLATPLYQGVPVAGDQPAERSVADVLSYEARLLKGKDASKASLAEVLHPGKGATTPAMLFTASHGLGWPRTHPAHPAAQGALLCQGYPVGDPLAGLPQPGDYLAAVDVQDDARVHGLVAFFFACFGAGTPEFNNYLYEGDQNLNFLFDNSQRPERLADRPFIAPLPQRLLSHPQGGALAVIGHVDLALGYSIRPLGPDFQPVPSVGPQLAPFRNCLGRILQGDPVGHATKDLSDKYAILAADLLTQLDKGSNQTLPPDAALAWTWVERNDARNYILLGDPAARLAVNKLSKPAARPATFAVAMTAVPPAAAAALAATAGVAFDVPDGYNDLTNYAFYDPISRRRLTVLPAVGLIGDDDLRTAAEGYRARAEDLCAAQDVAVSGVQSRADGAAMITIGYTFDEGPNAPHAGGTYRDRAAFVRFPNGDGVQLAYVAPGRDVRAEEEFRHMLDSVRPAGHAPAAFHIPAVTPAGTVRRQVRQVLLDVDASLHGPSAYQFVSGDGAVRLEVAVVPAGGPAVFAAPAMEAGGGAGGDLFTQVGQAAGDLGGPVRFEVVPDPWAAPAPGEPPAFAAPVTAAPQEITREVAGVRLRLTARSAPKEAASARQALADLGNSLRPAE
jgi:hypothetical protein